MARKARVFKPVPSNLELDKQIGLIKHNELEPRYHTQYILQTRISVKEALRNIKNNDKTDEEVSRIEDELTALELDIKAFESIVVQLESQKKAERTLLTTDEPTPEE